MTKIGGLKEINRRTKQLNSPSNYKVSKKSVF